MLLLAGFVLLISAGCLHTQDIMKPSVNILAEVGKIKSLEERLKKTEAAMRSQNNLVTELSSKLETLRSENGGLKATVRTLRHEIEALQMANKARRVAFSASLSASGAGHEGPHVNVTSTLIYRKVVTNYGGAYDSNTGIFTAPVKGVYYFRFYAHCHPGVKMAVSLYKNGNTQCSVFIWKPETNGNAGNGIVLTLEKGDEIYTRLWENTWVYDDANRYTSFGGFLLFPL